MPQLGLHVDLQLAIAIFSRSVSLYNRENFDVCGMEARIWMKDHAAMRWV